MAIRQNWRITNYSSKIPALNLAIDESILRYALEDHNINTLRWWRNPPSVIIGCFQNPKFDVDMAACEKIGINVLRRASGGGAVYHDYGNLNYSLIIHKSSLKFNIDNIEASYNVFCGAVIEGLKLLGIDAYNRGGDIIIHGKKVSGSAQHRLYDVVLHHGTLMIDVNFDVLGRALGLKDPEKYLINLGNVLSDKVSLKKIRDAVNKGFEKRFDIQLMKSVLTAKEKQIAEKLWKRKYSKRDWNIKKKMFIS